MGREKCVASLGVVATEQLAVTKAAAQRIAGSLGSAAKELVVVDKLSGKLQANTWERAVNFQAKAAADLDVAEEAVAMAECAAEKAGRRSRRVQRQESIKLWKREAMSGRNSSSRLKPFSSSRRFRLLGKI